MSSERRRAPRIGIVGRLHGHAVSLDVPIEVREMSLGGMSIATAFALPIGAVHEFSVTLGDGSAVVLAGRVKYSRPLDEASSSTFVSGIEFVDDSAAEPPPIDEIVKKLP